MAINPNQSSKYDDQPKPPSAKLKEAQAETTQKYVVLPHHPLYGCLVTIITRRVATTYVNCTIEDPACPDFRYHIRECWLSLTPPPPLPISPTPNEGICLRLTALDKIVQKLLTTPSFSRINDDEPTDHPIANSDPSTRSTPANLGSTSPDEPSATGKSPFLSGTRKSRRD